MSIFCTDDGIEATFKPKPGRAEWSKTAKDLRCTAIAHVHPFLPLRIIELEITGTPVQPVCLEWAIRPCMGENAGYRRHVYVGRDDESGWMYAENPYNGEYSCLLGIKISESDDDAAYTGSFPGFAAGNFNRMVGAGYDAVLAVRHTVRFEDGRARLTLLCAAPDKPDASNGVRQAFSKIEQTNAVPFDMRRYDTLRSVTITTPDGAINRYINEWAGEQIRTCRMYARTSVYQNGGAYGFRDQLQDACALVCTDPRMTKTQLLRAAAHQYIEGDVQHWWHGGGTGGLYRHKGVRTMCSDDLLWLPSVAARYVKATGDDGIMQIALPFLASPPLGEERERYEQASVANEKATLYEHCARAIDCLIRRGTGVHGLPLMLGGDWNDGINLAGIEGRGESVWLGRFACMVIRSFLPLATAAGDDARVKIFNRFVTEIEAACDAAWDGGWYIRGYTDDGYVLGSEQSIECKIDSIVQSFSVLARPDGPNKRDITALSNTCKKLVDRDRRVVRLFAPPFKETDAAIGYIQSYPRGVRENGGQYTHGAVWQALACFAAGKYDDGYMILNLLLPETHDEYVYKAEPYVLAADVYCNESHYGRGGWSWYTGAAGWYWRAVVNSMLGMDIIDNKLHINPKLPSQWKGYTAVWRIGASEYHISVQRGPHQQGMMLDGQLSSDGIDLLDDGQQHNIKYIIGEGTDI